MLAMAQSVGSSITFVFSGDVQSYLPIVARNNCHVDWIRVNRIILKVCYYFAVYKISTTYMISNNLILFLFKRYVQSYLFHFSKQTFTLCQIII